MNKLFLSIEVPAAIKQVMERQIENVRHVAPDAEWCPREKMHITLLFLGQDQGNAAHLVPVIESALSNLGRCEMKLTGAGTFPAGVLFIGCEPSRNLLRAHTALCQALNKPKGYWKAHFTLGKGRGVNEARDLLPVMPFMFSPTTVHLYRTSRSGASYQSIHEFKL